ncbi:hypothetical protein [uncultured Roseobacter sp.]|uniref:hypothetical protein n=1 Tax=uncultured Roseobacter sp. TaxID=114847 RepID=UPI002619EA90|nr:hypothetical protein [uncultured Roseobacter sp.]
MAKTQLEIEHVGPGADGTPGGVRLTATVPWSEMARSVMDRFVERRVAVPHDSTPKDEDDVYVSGDETVDYDALLIVGAVPAVVSAVARLRPSTIYGLLNGYAWEVREQRERLEGRTRPVDRNEAAWLAAREETIGLLLRELRFSGLMADGYTRDWLLKEERLLGGSRFAEEERRRKAS